MSRESMIVCALLAACCAALPLHAADESDIRLAPGAGLVETQSSCAICHSLDYIALNSPFLDHKGWEATVAKMGKAFGAPVRPEDAGPIADYLAKHYGKR